LPLGSYPQDPAGYPNSHPPKHELHPLGIASGLPPLALHPPEFASCYVPPFSTISPPLKNRHWRRTSRLNAHHYTILYLQLISPTVIPYHSLFGPTLHLFLSVSLDFRLSLLEAVKSSKIPTPTKTDCSYSIVNPSLPQVNHAVSWKPIGPVASVDLPPHYFSDSVDLSSSVKLRKGSQTLSPLDCSDGPKKQMLEDLLSLDVISPSSSLSFSFNLSLRSKPNSAKSLLISDCRSLIEHSVFAPKKFSLPKLSSLFFLKTGALHYFTKLDLSNAYHSIRLPSFLQDHFTFAAYTTSAETPVVFKWLRLPFGWDRSPQIFQSFMTDALSSISSSTVLVLSYLDDVLFVSPCLEALKIVTDKAVSLLASLGFLVSPPPKSHTVPVLEIDWLGKHLCSSHAGISICTPLAVLMLLASLIIFSRAKKGPARILRTISGIVSWCNFHCRLAFPFLHFAQSIAHKNARHLPMDGFLALISALHICSIPTAKTPIKWGLDLPLALFQNPLSHTPHPLQHLSPDHLFVFVDASISDGRMGLVVVPVSFPSVHPDFPPMAYSIPLPDEASNQQSAELYTIKFALFKLGRHVGKATFVADSESSLLTINKLSTKVRHHFRSKVLRQIAKRLLTFKSPSIPLAFVPGFCNPADLYSRPKLPMAGPWQGPLSPETVGCIFVCRPYIMHSPPFLK